jgi:hypothetical protein
MSKLKSPTFQSSSKLSNNKYSIESKNCVVKYLITDFFREQTYDYMRSQTKKNPLQNKKLHCI